VELFARLSVFAGGCTLEAAEEVAGADLDTLQSLVEKSLLRFTNERYWMLETIREYALERLEGSGESNAVRDGHAAWTLALAQRLKPDTLGGPKQANALQVVDANVPSIRSALLRFLEVEDYERAVLLCLALTNYWDTRHRTIEADSWYERALASDDLEPRLRAEALCEHSMFMINEDDVERASTAVRESLALYESAGDDVGLARSLARLGATLHAGGRLDEAKLALERSLELSVATAAREPERLAAHVLGEVQRDLGRHSAARELLDRSAAISAELGDDAGACHTWHGIGDLELDRRDLGAASMAYSRALVLARDVGSLRATAICLAGLACVAWLLGREDDARSLWGAFARYEDERGALWGAKDERARYERILGPIAVEPAVSAMSLEQATSFALGLKWSDA
jgi:tetratricopeptide (TPR) repeat protein